MKYNFIDLFCGAGGMSAGFIKAGMNCLVGIDFYKPAIETFKKNHKNAIAIHGDIKKISVKEIKKKIKNKRIHIICGGPPCQGFSTIGTNNAKDSRNHLFLDFVRFVKGFKPEIVVMENVTGLLAIKNSDTLKSIFRCFEALGYRLDIKVLSSNHYGVPQIRRRVILIGNKINVKNRYPKKKYRDIDGKEFKLPKSITVGDIFKEINTFKTKLTNHEIDKAQISNVIDLNRISFVPEGKFIRYEKDEKKYLPKKLWYKHDWNKIDEKRFREAKYHRLDRSKPSPTIVTSRTMYYHPTENRYLTTREAASLQSFPLEFEFCGNTTSQWTQIGNAVPVKMAFEIAKCLKEMLKDKKKITNKDNGLGSNNIEIVRSLAFNYEKDIYLFKEKKFKQVELPI